MFKKSRLKKWLSRNHTNRSYETRNALPAEGPADTSNDWPDDTRSSPTGFHPDPNLESAPYHPSSPPPGATSLYPGGHSDLKSLCNQSSSVEAIQTIPSITLRVLSGMDRILGAGSGRLSELLSLRNDIARFKVWVGSNGAHKIGPGSLEYRLHDASNVQQQVLRLLEDLDPVIQKILQIVTGETKPSGSSDQDKLWADDQESDDIEEEWIFSEVTSVIDCLVRLDISIHNPIPLNRFAIYSAANSVDKSSDMLLLRGKHTRMDDYLSERLSRAMSRRRHYLENNQSRYKEINGELHLRLWLDESEVTEYPLSLYVSDEQDSDSDSESLEASPNGPKVPLISRIFYNRLFQCSYCLRRIIVKDEKSWERHILSDLRPYNCVEEDCTTPDQEFTTKREWMHHMLVDHLTVYNCIHGCGDQFTSATESREHLKTRAHLGHIEESRVTELIQQNSQILRLDKHKKCPFCLETLTSLEHYGNHIGKHQRELALLSLPSAEGSEGTVTSSVLSYDATTASSYGGTSIFSRDVMSNLSNFDAASVSSYGTLALKPATKMGHADITKHPSDGYASSEPPHVTSGFETAGVVLGSIPLVISALEHYKQGISTIRSWRKYDRELRSLIRNLETERVRFQDVCEKLLVGLVPPSQIEYLVEDPFGPAWHEDAIHAKIVTRLWRSFSTFEDIVKDMEEAIKEIMKKLDLQPDGKIKWQEATFVVKEFKRASFALKRSDYAEQIATIKDGITSLESLIDRNIMMEPERKLRSQGRMMRVVRDISDSVYRALQSSFQCSCEHKLYLRLELRSIDLSQRDGDEEIAQKLLFNFVLADEQSIYTANGEQEQCERIVWKEFCIGSLPKGVNQVLIPAGTDTEVSGMGKKRSIGFHMFHSPATEPATGAGQPAKNFPQKPLASPTKTSVEQDFDRHINFCENIWRSKEQIFSDRYGIIRDRSNQTCREYGIYPTAPVNIDEFSVVSLREILEKPLEFPHMSVSVKLHMAAKIASSFLQLHQTPWLPEILTSRDILFLKRGAEFQYEHAFVMKGLHERLKDKQKGNDSAPSSRCPALLALGILLLELNLGRTIDSLQVQVETPPPGAPRLMYDSLTAQRLLQERRIDSLNFKSAVQRCIWGEFARQKLDLNDEDFRQEIYEKVVALLETDLKNATWSHDGGIY